jgi:hypothetical protein
MKTTRCPTRKLCLFALLSGLDFLLTWYLLGGHDGAAYESNPLAAWLLARGGWLGLAAFKAATVLLVGGLGLVIFRHRPRAGHRVLAFGCAALAAVVLYSGYLCQRARHPAAGLDPDEAAPLLSQADHLAAARQRSLAYKKRLARLTDQVRRRQCTLAEAAAHLAVTEQGRDPAFLRTVQVIYPGLSDAECLALSVLNNVAPEATATTTTDRQLRRALEAEFLALYGRPAPTSWERRPGT